MVCPYCQFEYTSEQPCFCHPASEDQPDDRSDMMFVKVSAEGEPIFSNTSRGNRLD